MAKLTKKQYEKFLEFTAADLPAPPIEQLEAVDIIAIDNLITRDKRQWSTEILAQAATEATGLVGKPLTLDHDWDKVDDVQGIICEANLLTMETCPDRILNTVERKSNKAILKNEGYSPLVVTAVFQSYNPRLAEIAMGAKKYVSFGGMRNQVTMWCPHDGLEFQDPDCKYLPPSQWWDYDEEELKGRGLKVADYAVYKGTLTFSELSLVLIPNLPGAQVIDRQIADFYS